MKILLMLIFILSSVSVAFSSELHQEDGILSNHSAEYVRSLNRNTSTDPDAAFYNPAGLAFMEGSGLYISFSSQTYYVKKSHSMDFYALQKLDSQEIPSRPPHKQEWFRECLPDEYMAELTAPSLPGVDIVWKDDTWAAFLDIAVMQAAIDMTYRNGLAVLDWGTLLSEETAMTEGTHLIQYNRNAMAIRNEMYVGITIGGACEMTKWISFGGGIRFINAEGDMKIKMSNITFVEDDGSGATFKPMPDEEDSWDVDTETKGFGFGVIAGTHIRPEPLLSLLKGLDFSFRVEYYPTMKLEKNTKRFLIPTLIEKSGKANIFKDGSDGKEMEYSQGNGSKYLKVTYPTTLNFGLSYLLFDWVKILTSLQISLRSMRDLDGREKDYAMGYQAGGGLEFILNPKITLSLGYLYNNFGIKPDKRTEADPLLNSHQVGCGAAFHVDENLVINIGAFYQYFIPATAYTTEYVNVSEPTMSYLRKDYEEERYSFSAGITYRWVFESKEKKKENKEEIKSEKVNKVKSNKNSTSSGSKNKTNSVMPM
jgi:opacity protein-like surface antigen